MAARQAVAIGSLCALLVGCVPGFVEYYRPQAPGGRAVSRACGTINAPKTIWQYKMGDVTLEAIVGEDHRDKPPGELILRFFVPVGTKVSLQSKEVSMRTTLKAQSRKLVLKKMQLYRGTFKKELKNLESTEFEGGTTSEFGLYHGKEIFLFSAEIQTPIEQELFISVGQITVDSVVYQVPEIRFVKEKAFSIYPINC